MIIYIDVCLLEKNKRYLISISDRKNILFSIDVFNGKEKQAINFANYKLKEVKRIYRYDELNKTIHITPKQQRGFN